MTRTARERAPATAAVLFVAARDDLSDPQKLHQLRIAGKRVRYALELLSSAFDDSVREAALSGFELLRDLRAVEVLLKAGAAVDARTSDGMTASSPDELPQFTRRPWMPRANSDAPNRVPLPKIFFFNLLLPGMLRGEDELVVIGGVYEVSLYR